MEKKEYYKHILPHFQQPGQAYFVTWILKDAIPPHALKRYADKLAILKSQIDAGGAVSNRRNNRGYNLHHPDEPPESNFGTPGAGAADSIRRNSTVENRATQSLLNEYHLVRKKYIKAYDDLLAVTKTGTVDLLQPEILEVVTGALMFWEGKRMETQAFCIMPNHVHWVFNLKVTDENGKLVYLQDIMHSVKRYSANQINKLTGRSGDLWQKESFDTTIRDEKHEYYAIRYTLNNPVAAEFVSDWKEWPGNWCGAGCGGL